MFVGSDVRAMFPAFVRESLLAVEFRERAYCAEQACCSDSADELTHQLDAVAASTRERASVYAYVVVTRRRSHGCVCPFDQMFPGKHVAACPLHAFEVADG